MEDADLALGFPVFTGHDWVASLPAGATLIPFGAVSGADRCALVQKLDKKVPGIRADGLMQVRVQLGKLGGVDVDGDPIGFAREILRGITRDRKIEPYANRQK